MSVYYNEIDPFACEWLLRLMNRNLIPQGDIDTRSISNVSPDDIHEYDHCHFFAGIGVWAHASLLANWSPDKPLWTGSCPCQPFSIASPNRTQREDSRHLFPEWLRLIRECRPPVIVGEQVASKDGIAWLSSVSTDLENENYAVGSIVFPACGIGAPHQRQRSYWVANTQRSGRERRVQGRESSRRETVDRRAGRDCSTGGMGDAGCETGQREPRTASGTKTGSEPERLAHGTGDIRSSAPGEAHDGWTEVEWVECRDGKHRPIKPGVAPLVDGFTNRVSVLRCLGNAIVAPQAKLWLETVMEII